MILIGINISIYSTINHVLLVEFNLFLSAIIDFITNHSNGLSVYFDIDFCIHLSENAVHRKAFSRHPQLSGRVMEIWREGGIVFVGEKWLECLVSIIWKGRRDLK